VHANGGENRKLGLQVADDGYARKAHNIRKPRLEKIVSFNSDLGAIQFG
jgi:hypothetical protein